MGKSKKSKSKFQTKMIEIDKNLNNKSYSNVFLTATRRLLVSLANKQKSKHIQKKERDNWARYQHKQAEPINNVINTNINNIISIDDIDKNVVQIQQEGSMTDKNSEVIVIEDNEMMKQNHIEQQNNNKQYLVEQIHHINQPKQALPQKLNNIKINLFQHSLKSIISILIKQIQQCTQCQQQSNTPCSRTVHSAIKSDQQTQQYFSKLSKIIKNEQNIQHVLNQDRMVLLSEKMQTDAQINIFSEQQVTIYEHRALAMLIKRINPDKYSLSISQNQESQSKNRNFMVQKFYNKLYGKRVSQYYQMLLQLQNKYKRYTETTCHRKKAMIGAKTDKIAPTNYIRKLLATVFCDKIRGKNTQEIMEIKKLEEDIDIAMGAELLLSRMRVNHHVKEKKEDSEQKQVIEETKNQSYTFRKELVGQLISQEQKLAIEKALLDYKNNKVEVPYPYCLFLEYRLQAHRQTAYKNPQFPSDDEEEEQKMDAMAKKRKIQRQMNVYRGYRGFKTNHKVAQFRKMNKGIANTSKLYSNEQQFYLKYLQDKSKEKAIEQDGVIAEDERADERDQQVKRIPYPYYLSIFKQDSQKSISFKNNHHLSASQNSSFNIEAITIKSKSDKQSKSTPQQVYIIDQ